MFSPMGEHSRLGPHAMPTHLNLLLLEDSLNDAELMLESLRDAGFALALRHVDYYWFAGGGWSGLHIRKFSQF
jgi:hypothetical protein